MSLAATYVSSTSFTVSGDLSGQIMAGMRVKADCGADGVFKGTVSEATYAAGTGLTTVTLVLDAGSLTANLAGVLHGNDSPDSMTNHGHTGRTDGGALAAYLPTVGGTMTGALTLAAWRDTRTALGDVSGPVTFNLALGASFSMTMTGNVTEVTFSGTPPDGSDGGIVVRMTNGGAYTWTWPTGMRWAGGSAPSFTATGLDIVYFLIAPSETPIGNLAAKDVK